MFHQVFLPNILFSKITFFFLKNLIKNKSIYTKAKCKYCVSQCIDVAAMCDDGLAVTTLNECATGGTTLLTDVVTTLSQTPVVITPKDGIASEPTSFVSLLSYFCDVYLI